MPKATSKKTPARKPSTFNRAAASSSLVAVWEDDPGDPNVPPPLAPIQVSAPNPAATPLPYKISGTAPSASIYQAGTPEFRYWAAAAALRRTANFWSGIIPSGTSWQLGKVLPVQLDTGVDLNAFYTRGGGGDSPGLHFFHDSVGGRVYYSGESPDVICHEMGHGVLDSLRPQLFDAQTIEAPAFHESFADMSALLSALQVPSFRAKLLSDTGGNINRSSRWSRLAEQLGSAIRQVQPDAVDPDCLRNACNSFFYTDPQELSPNSPASQLSSEPHSFSRVFTGAFFEILAGIFQLQGAANDSNLVQTSQDAAHILISGVLAAPVVPDYFSQVAASMVQCGEAAPFNGKYRDILKGAFVRKGILSLQAATTISGVRKQSARIIAPHISPAAELPRVAISAAEYGLSKPVLKVHLAAEPKRLGVTGAAAIGAADPRSPQAAAEAYTEDLFQRGHVDIGEHGNASGGLSHPFRFKSHKIFDEKGELVLKRIAFDCGFDHRLRLP
jgi:hypothetical protein